MAKLYREDEVTSLRKLAERLQVKVYSTPLLVKDSLRGSLSCFREVFDCPYEDYKEIPSSDKRSEGIYYKYYILKDDVINRLLERVEYLEEKVL